VEVKERETSTNSYDFSFTLGTDNCVIEVVPNSEIGYSLRR
jgi:hypothetical protein